jgi:hypothetical protein
MKRILLSALALWLAGCAGAGPAASIGPTGGRCLASSAQDAQRPLFFLFCVESP